MSEVVSSYQESTYPVDFLGRVPLEYARGARHRAARACSDRQYVNGLVKVVGRLYYENRELRIDSLTGLLVRRFLMDDLDRALNRADFSFTRVAVAFIDVDRLKEKNTSHGHPYGDRYLSAVARGIRQASRMGDSAYRYGGDEIVLLMPVAGSQDFEDNELITSLTDRLTSSIDFSLATERIDGGATIGMALSEPWDDPSELIARANQAMYDAKNSRGIDPSSLT